MDSFWHITVGNVIEIISIAGGGIWFLLRVSFQLGQILMRLSVFEKRVEHLENQITLPISQRRRIK